MVTIPSSSNFFNMKNSFLNLLVNSNSYLEKSILRPNNISHPKSRTEFLNLIRQ